MLITLKHENVRVKLQSDPRSNAGMSRKILSSDLRDELDA